MKWRKLVQPLVIFPALLAVLALWLVTVLVCWDA